MADLAGHNSQGDLAISIKAFSLLAAFDIIPPGEIIGSRTMLYESRCALIHSRSNEIERLSSLLPT